MINSIHRSLSFAECIWLVGISLAGCNTRQEELFSPKGVVVDHFSDVDIREIEVTDLGKSFQYDEVKEWYDKYQLIGKQMTTVLDDDDVTTRSADRAMAACVLGGIKHPEGLPILIKHIHLSYSSSGVSGNENRPLIAQRSLGMYGRLAIIDLVNAWLDESSAPRRDAIIHSIFFTKSGNEAFIYMSGLKATGDKRVTNEVYKEFAGYFGKPRGV